jgi:DNA repair photolyase
MSILYQPTGRAGEYAQLAIRGPYVGCSFACQYCYNPKFQHTTLEAWSSKVRPNKNFLDDLFKAAEEVEGDAPLVFMSFGCDPCQPLDTELGLTGEAIDLLTDFGIATHLLTKAGLDAIRYFPLLSRIHRSRFWTTLTCLSPTLASVWEPGAPSPTDRVLSLLMAHDQGIDTGASLEPTIYPEQQLRVIEKIDSFTRHISVGKLNHMTLAEVQAIDPEITEPPDWGAFCRDAKALLLSQGRRQLVDPHEAVPWGKKTFYIKRDLREV